MRIFVAPVLVLLVLIGPPRFQADIISEPSKATLTSWCQRGLASSYGCCPLGCGECGGVGCHKRPVRSSLGTTSTEGSLRSSLTRA